MSNCSSPERRIWSIFRRVTSNDKFIPEIDGLRFVAIMSVLFYHVARMTELAYGSPNQSFAMRALFNGGRGVELFFAISGMVLALPFARHYMLNEPLPSLRAYFARRVTRLEPPYLINLFMRFPMIPAAKGVSISVALTHLVASVFYVHGITYGSWPLIHQPSWSLEIEVQFYLLLPLVAIALYRTRTAMRRVCIGILIIAGSMLAHMIPQADTRLHLSLLCFAQFFLTGLLLADLHVSQFKTWRSSVLWDVLGIPLWFLVFTLPGRLSWIFPAIIVLCYIAAFKGKLLNKVFRNPVITTVGGMCYSIYLTHSLVLQGLFVLLKRIPVIQGITPHLVLGLVFIPPLLITTGAVFFVTIERPCMDRRWPSRLSGRVKSLRWFGGSSAPAELPSYSRTML
jgi:peptidoglycan/LPS O-acetylase OafA/YrhL